MNLQILRQLFQLATNFQMVPGDNDWNECIGYLPNANNGDLRDMWRNDFANANSPFYRFDNPSPALHQSSNATSTIQRYFTLYTTKLPSLALIVSWVSRM
mmetsp:Transcript_13847/g.23621  ORF Transcript_13847/g.23621 Transcript_13847/m.23621 type:complete len:100 (-) Transcript_13847:333-632(-)